MKIEVATLWDLALTETGATFHLAPVGGQRTLCGEAVWQTRKRGTNLGEFVTCRKCKLTDDSLKLSR